MLQICLVDDDSADIHLRVGEGGWITVHRWGDPVHIIGSKKKSGFSVVSELIHVTVLPLKKCMSQQLYYHWTRQLNERKLREMHQLHMRLFAISSEQLFEHVRLAVHRPSTPVVADPAFRQLYRHICIVKPSSFYLMCFSIFRKLGRLTGLISLIHGNEFIERSDSGVG